jgi:predicted metal-dependent hydrolase
MIGKKQRLRRGICPDCGRQVWGWYKTEIGPDGKKTKHFVPAFMAHLCPSYTRKWVKAVIEVSDKILPGIKEV